MPTLQMRWEVDTDTTKHRLNLSIQNEQPICFRYTKIDEKDWEARHSSAWEIQDTGTGEVVLTWDHMRGEVRTFRLDGIAAITTSPFHEYMRREDA